MNCTPSARLESKYDESSSVYAAEGTLAHEFGDLVLKNFTGEISQNVLTQELKRLRKDKLYTSEMEGEVEKYTDYVTETYLEAKAKNPDAKLFVEQRIDFSHLVEKGYGTGDGTIVSDGVLDIQDLKYGKGIQVYAEENTQLMLYGSGTLRAMEMLYDIHTVRLTIIQPRLNHIDTWDISADELRAWGVTVVKPLAKKAYEGSGVKKAGSWCKFCKIKALCKTLADQNLSLAQDDFQDPHLMTNKRLGEVYKQMPMLVDWVNAVGSHMLKEALSGEVFEGFKLVRGRSNRKWVSESKVEEILNKTFKKEQYTNTKLKGIGDVEKLVGKTEFTKLLGSTVIKPEGTPQLVDQLDKRPEMETLDSAKKDFQ